VDFAKFGRLSARRCRRIKKISGANLHRNWVMIPHVTNHDDADITDLEAFRVLHQQREREERRQGHHAGLPDQGLRGRAQEVPRVQQLARRRPLVYKQYFHIGFAADTPNGLVVPVIKDADKKGVMQISQEMGELAKKARDGKLGPADMSGACFTISSAWAALVGVTSRPSSTRPRWPFWACARADGARVGRQAVCAAPDAAAVLSWDHRVIDGACRALQRLLGADPGRLPPRPAVMQQ
jgi:pyruvate dehydrogenase E2 component (dihydrolipoamide acetyltransferase)